MPDIDDPFVPLGSDGLFVDPYESRYDLAGPQNFIQSDPFRSVISMLLTQLPKLFADIKNPEPALLPALNAAKDALAPTGGKIISSLSALPTWGPGQLFRRDDTKLQGIDTEKKLFQTEHPAWKKTASKMVESGIGVDFFIAAPQGVYMDIATIGKILIQDRQSPDAEIADTKATSPPSAVAKSSSSPITTRGATTSSCR